jgi:hypothetical protein
MLITVSQEPATAPCPELDKSSLRCEISDSHGGKYEVYRVFWVVAPYSRVEVDRRFRDMYCLYHQGCFLSP